MILRTALIGSVQFSKTCLEAVALSPHVSLEAVFCPAREDARYNADYVDLAPIADRIGVPCHRIGRLDDPKLLEVIRDLRLDLLLVLGISKLVPRSLFTLPRLGSIGSHPSLLPVGRGRHPLIWALVHGLEESGLSFFWLDDGADTGDIVWQRAFPITVEDDAASLYRRIEGMAVEGLNEFLPQLAAGNLPRTPQDESRATVWRKRTQVDGEIDWSQPAMSVHNLIRALAHPYPGAHTVVRGERVILQRSRPAGARDAASGTPAGSIVRITDFGIEVQCGDGTVEVAPHSGLSSPPLRVGDTFESLRQ